MRHPTLYRVECCGTTITGDACGWGTDEDEDPERVLLEVADEVEAGGRLHTDGRFECRFCTPEGRAMDHVGWVRLAQRAWSRWGIGEDRAAEVAGAMLAEGRLPHPDPPVQAL